MNKDEPGQHHGNGDDVAEALKHVREAEHELADARKSELRAEEHLEEAVEELEHAEHDKPHTVTIIVNGTPHEVPKKEMITYVEVVTLAEPDYPKHPEVTYSVTWTRGRDKGVLSPGGSVKVKDGMEFRVNRSGQS